MQNVKQPLFLCDIGAVHQQNQDNGFNRKQEDGVHLSMVADGHGKEGQIFSKALVDRISVLKLSKQMTNEEIVDRIKHEIFKVEYEGIQKGWDGGTTVSVVAVVQRKGGIDIICASLGDSPAYLIYCKKQNILYHQLNEHDDLDQDQIDKEGVIIGKVQYRLEKQDYTKFLIYQDFYGHIKKCINMGKSVGDYELKRAFESPEQHWEAYKKWINVDLVSLSRKQVQKWKPFIMIGSDGTFEREMHYLKSMSITGSGQPVYKEMPYFQFSHESVFRLFFNLGNVEQFQSHYMGIGTEFRKKITTKQISQHIYQYKDYLFCWQDDFTFALIKIKYKNKQAKGNLKRYQEAPGPIKFTQCQLDKKFFCTFCKADHPAYLDLDTVKKL